MAAAAASGLPVLASVRAWVPRSPAGRESRRLLRLQLSAAPGPERFRLGWRGGADAGPEPTLVEYSLRDISYEPKSATCHELKVLAHPDDPVVFHFEDEQEAQKWWTVVSSSLREVEKEELALRLSAAIETGDEAEAMRWATALAQQHTPLRILLKEICYPTSEISLKVQVEDALRSAHFTTRVHTFTTIATLRQQVFQDYEFHPRVQRWIIGQCLCVDDRTLGSYGIRKDGDVAFLYLLTAKGANLSEQRYKEDKDWVVLQPAPSSLANGADARRNYSTLPSPAPKKGVKDSNRKMDIGEISHFLGSLKINSLLSSHAHSPPASMAVPPSPMQAGWPCPVCTFINKPTRPGCEMCSTDRPANYVVPGSYTPDEMERRRMQQEKEGILQYQQEKGRREDGSAVPCAQSLGSLDDFIHLSSEFS